MNREMEVKDLVGVFRNQLGLLVTLILLFEILGGLVGYYYPEKYEAKIDLLVNSSVGKEENRPPSMGEIDTSLRLIQTYKQILKSDRLISKVNSRLGGSYSKSVLEKKIKIESGNESQIITIVAREGTPEKASTLANTYALTFQEESRILMNLDNILILKDVIAGEDTEKVKPAPQFYLPIFLIISILISLGIVLIKELFFPLLNTKEKVESVLKTPLLGVIAKSKREIKKIENRNKISMNLLNETQFPRAENEDFKKLAANVHYSIKQQKVKTFLMASPSLGVGKTFVSSNLAATMALDGKKTLFIDADLRKSDGRILFNLHERKGLTSIISGSYELDEVIQATNIENLSFISTGPLPSNPAKILLSDDMEKILQRLKTMFDVIVLDSPALNVSESVCLLPIVDGCIFIVDTKKTKQKKAIQSLQMLKEVDTAIIGTILNGKRK